MPATEKTWRDQKLLNLVFGVTSVLLLLSTVWMFARDHNRSWKKYQVTMRDVETRMTAMREVQENTDKAVAERRRLEAELAEAIAQPPAAEQLDAFQQRLRTADSNVNLDRLQTLIDAQATAGQAALDSRKAYADAMSALEDAQQAAADAEQSATDAEAAGEENAAELREAARTAREQAKGLVGELDAAAVALAKADAEAEAARQRLLDAMQGFVKKAKDAEDNSLKQRKNASALLDEIKANRGLAVRDEQVELLDEWQAKIDAQQSQVEDLDRVYRDAQEHRRALDGIVRAIQSQVAESQKALDAALFTLTQLENSQKDRRSNFFEGLLPGKRWLELPILDAFNSPVKVENLWSDGLTQTYGSFGEVRRFDRCTTCHQAMDKTAPGSAVDPAYPHVHEVELVLATTPDEDEEIEIAAGADSVDEQLTQAYGVVFATKGLLEDAALTVSYVQPASLAARAKPSRSSDLQPVDQIQLLVMSGGMHGPREVQAGLQVGDVISAINGDPVFDPQRGKFRLADAINSGKTLRLTVRRGLQHPYSSHPRLDLFVGSLSPHTKQEFACTICHEGQGSATEFKWASHTPDSRSDRKNWSEEYGWFDNHHWIYPMFAKRFVESSCLKCHHEVTELKASERFPEPPAPKVTHGYDLFTKYGCFGCHEVNGYDGPDKRVGPDRRLEPNYFAAALALQTDPGYESLSAEQQGWFQTLIQDPSRSDLRHQILKLFEEDLASGEPQFSDQAHNNLTGLLQDQETPGGLRKVGPSLRHVASKDDAPFLFDWITAPKRFRESSRMPQFFQLWKHLEAEPEQLHKAQLLEPVEVFATSFYLLQRSQEFEYLAPPENISESTPEESVARGKVLFEERGCLACHNHGDFPESAQYRPAGDLIQGPDLTHLGSKFDPARNPDGARWLYSWIKEPTRYNPRTLMPHLYLDPITKTDANGDENVTDPVADIVAYLMSSTSDDWAPEAYELDEAALDQMTLEHLKDTYYEKVADGYLKTGIPTSVANELKGAEVELLTDAGSLSRDQKLLYVGRKTIAKYGCYGCHDIPGFEDAKPIGAALADWGRKEPEKLAFEHIHNYLHGHGHGGHGGDAAHGDEAHGDEAHGDHAEHLDGPAPGSETLPDFYMDQLNMGNRIGFAYQKIREPRSYDYQKATNKKYNEKLRMPLFPFTHEEREAVLTFVLGLVADPPRPKYVYQPDERTLAINEGRAVLEKYSCQSCHLMNAEKWTVEAPPGYITPQLHSPEYPFATPKFTSKEVAASEQVNQRGNIVSEVIGVPLVNESGVPKLLEDDEGDYFEVEEDGEYDPSKLVYSLAPWRPTLIDGSEFRVGLSPLELPADQAPERQAAWGGYLAKFLLPRVTAREKEVNPNANGREAWGWVPPPLIGEGNKVQAEWLHDFLLEPHMIRPASVLRMPRFNMSSEEAGKLVNFFAARDQADYPYQINRTQRSDELASKNAAYLQTEGVTPSDDGVDARFRDAMKIVTSSNYCVKCHLVGDFMPAGSDRAKAPNLAIIHRRMQEDYLRQWIGNPKSILPYTSMPVNVPYDPEKPHLGTTVPQDLYHGDAIQQVDALVDLLMNFDVYAKQRSAVAPLVQTAPPTEEAPADAAAAAASDAD